MNMGMALEVACVIGLLNYLASSDLFYEGTRGQCIKRRK